MNRWRTDLATAFWMVCVASLAGACGTSTPAADDEYATAGAAQSKAKGRASGDWHIFLKKPDGTDNPEATQLVHDIQGKVKIRTKRTDESATNFQTTIELEVSGLEPNHAFGAHVHVLPCEPDQGGSHYKNDPTLGVPAANNELWLDFTTDEEGEGEGETKVDWLLRSGEARSIVIHSHTTDATGAAGARLACIDLEFSRIIGGSSGTWTLYEQTADKIDNPAAKALIGNIEGRVDLVVDFDLSVMPVTAVTKTKLRVKNVEPNHAFMAHVHALPCGDPLQGGGHYKHEPTPDTIEANEIWLNFTSDDDGDAKVETIRPWAVSAGDARSVVIHSMVDDGAGGMVNRKLGCIDIAY